MKMFNKAVLSGFFGLSDEEDEEFYDTSEQVATQNTIATEEKHSNASFFRQPVRENERVAPTNTTETYENKRTQSKVVAMNTTQSKNSDKRDTRSQSIAKKISVIEPRTYTESKDIAKCVFRNEIAIVNFHLVDETQARRIVDFLTGAIYALDGDIQRIGDEIFLCTPANMEIDSSVAKSLLGTQFA